MTLTPAERELVAAIGFDEAVLLLVKGHRRKPVERVMVRDEAGTLEPGPGLSVAVGDGEEAEWLMATLEPELGPRGYRAFWSEREAASGLKEADEVVVLRTQDPYAIVRLRRSDGANYGIFTEDIIDRLRAWEAVCRFEVVGAGSSWVALRFETLPDNVCAFAEEVYLFCPDSVEQGVGLLREPDHPELFRAARELCPEISPRVSEHLDAGLAKFEELVPTSMSDELRALMQRAMELSTPTDMGVRLLAHELRRAKYAFLWWD